MRKFSKKLIASGRGDVVCDFDGIPTTFPLKKVSFQEVLDFRSRCVEDFSKVQVESADDSVKAFEFAYMMRVNLVREGIDIALSDEEASSVIASTGGINGPLVNALVDRFGVQDIFNPKQPGGNLEAEIPT